MYLFVLCCCEKPSFVQRSSAKIYRKGKTIKACARVGAAIKAPELKVNQNLMFSIVVFCIQPKIRLVSSLNQDVSKQKNIKIKILCGKGMGRKVNMSP